MNHAQISTDNWHLNPSDLMTQIFHRKKRLKESPSLRSNINVCNSPMHVI